MLTLAIYCLVYMPGSSVSIEIRLRNGETKNRISFLGRDGCFSSSAQWKPRVLPLGQSNWDMQIATLLQQHCPTYDMACHLWLERQRNYTWVIWHFSQDLGRNSRQIIENELGKILEELFVVQSKNCPCITCKNWEKPQNSNQGGRCDVRDCSRRRELICSFLFAARPYCNLGRS
jgi:hypothetical protein